MTTTPTAQAGLPALPEQQYSHFGRGLVPVKGYTADQMREYAVTAVRAAQAAQPCIMCHGQGWHYMADAYLPGQGEAPKIKVKCNQCKVQAAQPTRKALSDAEIAECLAECDTTIQPRYLHKIFTRAIEAKHGIHPAGKEAG